jgi:hypothetical protein
LGASGGAPVREHRRPLHIERIREKFLRGRFEFSQHAVDQTIVRRISVQEIREAISVGQIIEDYPEQIRSQLFNIGFHRATKAFAHPVQLCVSSVVEDHNAL